MVFSHIVVIWLNDSPGGLEKVWAAAEKLRDIPVVQQLSIGTPSPSDRPVVDGSYSIALNILLKDKAAEQEYQIHPLHKDFVAILGPFRQKIVIYDFADNSKL